MELNDEVLKVLKVVTDIAPEVSKQILQMGTFDNTVGAIFGAILGAIGIITYFKMKEDDKFGATMFGCIFGLLSFSILYCCLFTLYKINYTPQLYILEHLLRK